LTPQREENGLGSLYDYNARFYFPVLGRFISADTMVPDGKNPQQFNRYAYGLNNPVKYIDPTGHDAWWCSSNKCEEDYYRTLRRQTADNYSSYSEYVSTNHVPYEEELSPYGGTRVNAKSPSELKRALSNPSFYQACNMAGSECTVVRTFDVDADVADRFQDWLTDNFRPTGSGIQIASDVGIWAVETSLMEGAPGVGPILDLADSSSDYSGLEARTNSARDKQAEKVGRRRIESPLTISIIDNMYIPVSDGQHTWWMNSGYSAVVIAGENEYSNRAMLVPSTTARNVFSWLNQQVIR
jgi:RHS repeat-associated protein